MPGNDEQDDSFLDLAAGGRDLDSNGPIPRHGGQAPMHGPARVLDADEVQGVLSGAFYAPPPRDEERSRRPRAQKLPRPAHYRVICISLYTKDLEALDAAVDVLKTRGITKASRSALIRVALEQLDLDKVPRGM
jgi:hypothetical protein